MRLCSLALNLSERANVRMKKRADLYFLSRTGRACQRARGIHPVAIALVVLVVTLPGWLAVPPLARLSAQGAAGRGLHRATTQKRRKSDLGSHCWGSELLRVDVVCLEAPRVQEIVMVCSCGRRMRNGKASRGLGDDEVSWGDGGGWHARTHTLSSRVGGVE